LSIESGKEIVSLDESAFSVNQSILKGMVKKMDE
jgi:hypothetical protein